MTPADELEALRAERDMLRRNLRRALEDAAIHAALHAHAEAAIARARSAIHIADDEDVTDWQRGYRACAVVATQALDATDTARP